jgi:hypothetical protein
MELDRCQWKIELQIYTRPAVEHLGFVTQAETVDFGTRKMEDAQQCRIDGIIL